MHEEIRERIDAAVENLEQANAVFNFVTFALGGFVSSGDSAWDHKLAVTVSLSRLLETVPDDNEETIVAASREIAFRRLPRLLCLSLVSIVETCLTDVARILLRNGAADPATIEKKVASLMRGGPAEYLEALSEQFQLSTTKSSEWDSFQELVATRNVLTHAHLLIADSRYLKNAGPSARVGLHGSLDVDNGYLLNNYIAAKGALWNLSHELLSRP